MSRKSAYNIPVQLLVRIGDSDPIPLDYNKLPWPYDAYKEFPRMLRETADAIEKESS